MSDTKNKKLSRDERKKLKDRERRKAIRAKNEKRAKRLQDSAERKNSSTKKQGQILSKLDRVSSFFSDFTKSNSAVSHTKLFKFGMLTMVGVTLMTLGSLQSYAKWKYNVKVQNETETIFSDKISFSKSDTGITLGKPVMSEDGTTTYIPMTFESMANLPTDADSYVVYLLATDGKLSYKPVGQFILYSTSGRGVLKITSPTGIKNEVVQVMVKNTKELGSNDVVNEETVTKANESKDVMEQLKSKTDIAMFTVNLAGKSIKRDAKLNGDVDTSYLYRRFFANEAVKELRKDVEKTQKQIERLYTKSDEIREILTRDGYAVPDTPSVATKDGFPSIVYPIKFDGDLDTGFVNDSDREAVNTAIVQQAQVKNDETVTVDDSSVSSGEGVTYQELGTLPRNLNKNDGTNSGDLINKTKNESNAKSASEYWNELVSVWQQIVTYKKTIYQDKALELYQIQLDYERQVDSVTVGSSKNFNVLGKVEVEKSK